MRILITVLLTGLLFSCKKEQTTNPLYEPYLGTWEYEKHIGFITDSLPAGNGRIIDLSSKGTFESRKHDTVLFKGVYSLQEKGDCSPRAETTFFATNDSAFVQDGYIALKNGRLTITTSNCMADGGTTFYRRIGAALND